MEDVGEIEYLDEDEEIVQQYVQTVQTLPQIQDVKSDNIINDYEKHITPLLVERRTENKRKYKQSEDDSDYDPTEDLAELHRKRKQQTRVIKYQTTINKYPIKVQNFYNKPTATTPSIQQQQKVVKTYENKLKKLPNLIVKKQSVSQTSSQLVKDRSAKVMNKVINNKGKVNMAERRKMDIRIPDYEDPICLPVRAFRKDENDLKRLRIWNNLCLEQFKKGDGVFRPPNGEAVSSSRTLIFRNVRNKNTGRMETTIWGKNSVENNKGDIKSENFQSVLPKYKEKTVIASYILSPGQPNIRFRKHTFDAVLCKEETKDDQSLVVYMPKEGISAVYKFADNKNCEEGEELLECEKKRVLREMTSVKICAPCYQSSWRGVRKRDNNGALSCPLCARSVVSLYSLLTHVRSNHTAADVHNQRATLARMLAGIVDYHYKCRICREQFMSIKLLRKHVKKHQGADIFTCEVGNHITVTTG